MARRRSNSEQDPLPLPNLPVFPEHLGALRTPLSTRFTYVSRIAEGKTGIAYKLSYNSNSFLSVCLKTARPSLTDRAQLESIRDSLKKEVEILRPLSHRCLPSIIDDGTSQTPPYYICSFQAGTTFFEAKQADRRITLRETVFVVSSLIDVLKYLHSIGRTHCDLHSNNILLGDDILRDGLMVIDFGSGHRESDATPITANRGNVNMKAIEGQRFDRALVDRSEFSDEFRRADLNALGKLLAQMYDVFMAESSAATREEYRRLCADLQSGTLLSWDAIENRFDLVVEPYRILGRNADLFVIASGGPASIIVPAIDAVIVGDPSLSIINTKQFQRLRSLKQLSFCDWHFPGATHTRFEHSLGVFGNAKQCIDNLAHHSSFRSSFSPDEIRGFYLASLVHDIGHYPFAHVIEQYAAGRFPENEDITGFVRHETRTAELIERDPELTRQIRESWGDSSLVQAKRVLLGQSSGLSELLDGPIDIDKLDYLRRDARHCGVPFGEGLDARKVLESLQYVAATRSIGVSVDGLASVEGLLVLQDQMLGEVYWHQAVRAVIAMFHAVLAFCVRTSPDRFKTLVLGIQDCSAEAQAIEKVILPAIQRIPDSELRENPHDLRAALVQIAHLFLEPSYAEIFRPLAVYRRTDDAGDRQTVNVYNSLVRSTVSGRTYFGIDWKNVSKLRACLLEALREKKLAVHELDVVIDVPIGKHGHRHVQVIDERTGQSRPIVQMSHVSASLFDDPAAHWSPARVYVSPRVFHSVKDKEESIIASAEERFFHGTIEGAI